LVVNSRVELIVISIMLVIMGGSRLVVYLVERVKSRRGLRVHERVMEMVGRKVFEYLYWTKVIIISMSAAFKLSMGVSLNITKILIPSVSNTISLMMCALVIWLGVVMMVRLIQKSSQLRNTNNNSSARGKCCCISRRCRRRRSSSVGDNPNAMKNDSAAQSTEESNNHVSSKAYMVLGMGMKVERRVGRYYFVMNLGV
jgi:glucan phosphoethanolaminetransferase (alkaline phosphatase superfamily)